MKIYDFGIIGGGPAGSTIATRLAERGYSVLILEKERFPREHVGESMLPVTYSLLKELGVYEEMTTRFFRKPGVAFMNNDGTQASTWCFKRLIKDEGYLSFHVRRAEFDQMLLQNAGKRGVEIIEEAPVKDVLFEEGKPVRLVGMDTTWECKFVIDATGQDTFLAKKFKTKKVYDESGIRNAFFAHWENPIMDEALLEGNLRIVYLGEEKNGWMWMIPVAEDRISIGVVLDIKYVKHYRRNVAKNKPGWEAELYHHVLSETPVVQKTIKTANVAMKVNSKGNYSYIVDDKFGKQYAMVGDSATFIDPIFASGIYLAMRSAFIISEGLDAYMKSGNLEAVNEAYQKIDGAYTVIKELIKVYYDKNAIRFDEIPTNFKEGYTSHETAIHIFHLLISGNFFDDPEKYLRAIEQMKNYEKYQGLKELSGYNKHTENLEYCT